MDLRGDTIAGKQATEKITAVDLYNQYQGSPRFHNKKKSVFPGKFKIKKNYNSISVKHQMRFTINTISLIVFYLSFTWTGFIIRKRKT